MLERLMILAAAVLFSTGGAVIKAVDLSAWQIASFRSGIAMLAVLAALPSARRGWSRRTVLVAVAYAATLVLYVSANKLTTAANTIFLQDTAPLYILLLSPWLLGERIRRRDLLLMTALGAGMALFFIGRQAPSATAPDPVLGNLLAVASGVTWALVIIGLRWLGRGQGAGEGPAAVACGNLLAFVLLLPWALPVPQTSTGDWLLVAFLGVFQIGLAYIFLIRGMRSVPALEASLLLLLEPVLNPVWAWLVHGEQPASLALLGGLVILGATAANTWIGRRSR